MNITCKKIQIESTKYDGTPRSMCEGRLVSFDGSAVRVFIPKGTPEYSAKANEYVDTSDNVLDIYFTDRWYNVYLNYEGQSNLWYCNIAMPAEFDGQTLRWVDLEIDIRCETDGSLSVLDEDEFEENRVKMSFPAHVVTEALSAKEEVLRLAGEKSFPFDHEAQLKDVSHLVKIS